MRLLITRPRIQYDSTAIYEPLIVEYHDDDFTVWQLKELIAKRQKLLSTGEKPRVGKEDPQVIARARGARPPFSFCPAARAPRASQVPPHDQILLIHQFRDSSMNGVYLENHLTLASYGITENLDDNLFLRRSNPLKEEIAEILLVDEHHLTPGQKHRMRDAIAQRDINYFRHCIQM